MEETYKQPIKEISRLLIWKNAVESLTSKRKENQVLNSKYIQRLWDYVFEDTFFKHSLLEYADEGFLDDWISYANQVYGRKKPDELKIAYLCGPEPENDLEILVELGVRVENVYAFESEKSYFQKAIKSIKSNFPTLKIFNGKIEQFLNISPVSFDIIYLDFTSPIFSNVSKPYQTVDSIFDSQALSELGILITNTCFPDKTTENIEFLESYFLHQKFSERNVFMEDDEDDGDSSYSPIIDENGFYEREQIRKYIDKNFWHAYSAFATHYPIFYSNLIQPTFRALKNPLTAKRLFTNDSKTIDKQIAKLLGSEDVYIDRTSYSFIFFLQSLIGLNDKTAKGWLSYFSQNQPGLKISKETAIYFLYLYRHSVYENFMDILSDELKNAIPKIIKQIPDRRGGLFCDVPMIHLWLELAVNQLGYPYHSNTKNHKRYSYKAKTREMCLDIFTFDRCRALYDWLPMIEYYEDDLSVIERQMLTRICVDAIGKHSIHILPDLYIGSAIVGINEKKWSENSYFSDRVNIEDEFGEFE